MYLGKRLFVSPNIKLEADLESTLNVCLIASVQNEAVEDNCLQFTCDQLSSNGARNSSHECYDYFFLGCTNITVGDLLKESNPINVSSISRSSLNISLESPGANNVSAYDENVKKIEKAKIENIVNNIFVNPKRYKSKVLRMPPRATKSVLTQEGANPNDVDIAFMNQTFLTFFSKRRNYQYDPKYKEVVHKAVIDTFLSYGLEAEMQKFEMYSWTGKYDAKNLIGILPSPNYKKKGDRVFVLGGHYDTVYDNPGVDDNGSGSVLVLEAARLLSKYKGKLNATIYFVLFDQEESGLDGSAAFVKSYYIPKVLDKLEAVHVGAYITDMVLLYDKKDDSQILPSDIKRMTPEAYEWIKNNSNRGDFISVWSRKNVDTDLWNNLKEAWDKSNPNGYKILLMDAPIPADSKDVTYSQRSSTFYRSDHASFWSSSRFHSHVKSLSAVLLCDLGPWRGYQRQCYHQPCDNTVQLTPENMNFMAKVVKSVIASTLKIVKQIN